MYIFQLLLLLPAAPGSLCCCSRNPSRTTKQTNKLTNTSATYTTTLKRQHHIIPLLPFCSLCSLCSLFRHPLLDGLHPRLVRRLLDPDLLLPLPMLRHQLHHHSPISTAFHIPARMFYGVQLHHKLYFFYHGVSKQTRLQLRAQKLLEHAHRLR